MKTFATVVLAVLLIAGCGGDVSSEDSQTPSPVFTPSDTPTPAGGAPADVPATPSAVTESPADQADTYALEKSGGERNGCSLAAPGQEAENDPGCLYGAAFAGCLEGITGEQVGPFTAEEEWANEPALVEAQLQATADCTA